MKYFARKVIDHNHIDFCDSLLKGAEYRYDTEEVPCIFTVRFDNGFESDIKVVNADPPYIDAVLFDNFGNELMCLDPWFEQVDGYYEFEYDEDLFVVELVKE